MTALARIPTTVNTDGLEWRRGKWSWPFKLYYFLSSLAVCMMCKTLVSDSRAIQRYYRSRFYKKTKFIPYGTPAPRIISNDRQLNILQPFDLDRGRYFLQITRIEPENLPLEIVEGFLESELSDDGFKMVIVGLRENTKYAQRLMVLADRRGVQVQSATYDPELLGTLRQNCFCYVHGNSVGGTNPALLEAMASSPRVLALDCEYSQEVLGTTAHYFDREGIGEALRKVTGAVQSPEMRNRAYKLYQWDAVAQSYMRFALRDDSDQDTVIVQSSLEDRPTYEKHAGAAANEVL